MKILFRILLILILLIVALFCAFGFLATFEAMPTMQRIFFQLLYGGGGVVCMFTIMRLVMQRSK